MFVSIHGCLCMNEQKVKDDVSNASHNDISVGPNVLVDVRHGVDDVY